MHSSFFAKVFVDSSKHGLGGRAELSSGALRLAGPERGKGQTRAAVSSEFMGDRWLPGWPHRITPSGRTHWIGAGAPGLTIEPHAAVVAVSAVAEGDGGGA